MEENLAFASLDKISYRK
jgi:tetratricopeptide (TPR) repeat protein